MKRILLIEDDEKLSRQLVKVIQGEDFAIDAVGAVEELEFAIGKREHYDLVILDRLVGCVDLKDRLHEIKNRWQQTPVLVISAISTPTERADLINLGADDYLGKPFITDEFTARVRSLARRVNEKKSDVRKIGNAQLSLTLRKISVGTKFDVLPAREFMLLAVLSESPGKVVSRGELLEAVWGKINHAETNLVEATVTHLRKRLSGVECNFEIKNQRGTGYWIEG